MLKKILIGTAIFFVGGTIIVLLLVAIFGENSDERNARLLKEKNIADSIKAENLKQSKIKDSIHTYRLKNDRN